MSPKKWSKNTFGWARAEVLGALVNAVFLVALCFSILVESLKRLYEIEPIHEPEMILYVGAMGLAVNIIGLFLFHRKQFLIKSIFYKVILGEIALFICRMSLLQNMEEDTVILIAIRIDIQLCQP